MREGETKEKLTFTVEFKSKIRSGVKKSLPWWEQEQAKTETRGEEGPRECLSANKNKWIQIRSVNLEQGGAGCHLDRNPSYEYRR